MEAHIFDLDGTLADSMSVWAGSVLAELDGENVKYPADVIKRVVTMDSNSRALFLASLGLSGTPEQINERVAARMYGAYAENIPPKRGAVEYVRRLREEGNRLYVLTASPHGIIEAFLRRVGVLALFEAVRTADDLGMKKSDPRIYAEAARRIGSPPSEICFYDDNLAALAAAKQAGLRTCGVYDPYSETDAEIIRLTADTYVRDFTELLK